MDRARIDARRTPGPAEPRLKFSTKQCARFSNDDERFTFPRRNIFRDVVTDGRSWRRAFPPTRKLIRDTRAHSALHSAVRYAIRDISIPNISHKATPPRAVILNIIYVRPAHKERATALGSEFSSLEGTRARARESRRTKARARQGGLQSKNNIDPLFGLANKYHKYRPAELSD